VVGAAVDFDIRVPDLLTRIDSIESIRLSYLSMEEAASSTAESRPTLADVAALAGVSASTASLAFSGAGPVSDATKAKVLAAAEQLNYAGPDPRAQSLRRGRSGIVGVVLEQSVSDAFRDPMNIATLDGISDAIGPSGSALLLLTENADGPSSFRSVPIDAVVLIGCSTRLADAVQVFSQRGVPIVGIETEPMDDVLAIDLENREGSRELAQHLKDLGHTEVAMVTLSIDAAHERGWLTPEREARSEGYTASQRIIGVRDVFAESTGYVTAASTVDEGRLAAREVLSREPRPTAIVAQSDLLAVGVILGAQELGLSVPDDLSVVGFDGVRLDGIAPIDLTTMVQPAFAKGRAAGEGVLALLDGSAPEGRVFASDFHRGAVVAPLAR
jgi:DNA-binding LacI/PurR family transcriptional regulator